MEKSIEEKERYIYSKSIEPTIEEITYKRKKSFSHVENVNGVDSYLNRLDRLDKVSVSDLMLNILA